MRNCVLHDAPSSTIRKLQRAQNNAARIILHATLDRRSSHYCTCHFDGHHSPDDLQHCRTSDLELGTSAAA